MSRVPTIDEHLPLKTPVEDLLALLGRPHMSSLLYAIGEVLESPVRFRELEDLMGISPTTLSERLRNGVDAGLLRRVAYDENPPRVEYSPTQNARDLVPAFRALHEWCRSHELKPVDAAAAGAAEDSA